MARAPQAILQAQAAIVGGVGGAVASGIVGDANHSYGYHRARTEIASNDYSAVLPLDREGPGDAASALDISLPPNRMIEVTARLRAAAGRNDPRLYALREFAGTLDGRTTFNRDLSTSIEGFAQWDDSHLWHVHLSGYRKYADDPDAWRAIADVFTDAAPIGGGLSEEDDVTPEQDIALRTARDNSDMALGRIIDLQVENRDEIRPGIAFVQSQVGALAALVAQLVAREPGQAMTAEQIEGIVRAAAREAVTVKVSVDQ